jgi:hypothetical protein
MHTATGPLAVTVSADCGQGFESLLARWMHARGLGSSADRARASNSSIGPPGAVVGLLAVALAALARGAAPIAFANASNPRDRARHELRHFLRGVRHRRLGDLASGAPQWHPRHRPSSFPLRAKRSSHTILS